MKTKKIKPSQVLIDTPPKIKQHFGAYYNTNKSAYCVVGRLGCVKSMFKNPYMLPSTIDVLEEYGLSHKDICISLACPECERVFDELPNMLVHLNDSHHYTFYDVGAYLKALGY